MPKLFSFLGVILLVLIGIPVAAIWLISGLLLTISHALTGIMTIILFRIVLEVQHQAGSSVAHKRYTLDTMRSILAKL